MSPDQFRDITNMMNTMLMWQAAGEGERVARVWPVLLDLLSQPEADNTVEARKGGRA